MSPGFRLSLLGGCVLVAALVSPYSARVVTEDLLGPYALQRVDASETDLANAVYLDVPSVPEDPHGDARGDADHETAHDAP